MKLPGFFCPTLGDNLSVSSNLTDKRRVVVDGSTAGGGTRAAGGPMLLNGGGATKDGGGAANAVGGVNTAAGAGWECMDRGGGVARAGGGDRMGGGVWRGGGLIIAGGIAVTGGGRVTAAGGGAKVGGGAKAGGGKCDAALTGGAVGRSTERWDSQRSPWLRVMTGELTKATGGGMARTDGEGRGGAAVMGVPVVMGAPEPWLSRVAV